MFLIRFPALLSYCFVILDRMWLLIWHSSILLAQQIHSSFPTPSFISHSLAVLFPSLSSAVSLLLLPCHWDAAFRGSASQHWSNRCSARTSVDASPSLSLTVKRRRRSCGPWLHFSPDPSDITSISNYRVPTPFQNSGI